MNYLGLPTSLEMQAWCSILGHEMLRWPGVKMCHVFGTCAFYRRKVMFAILPDKRSLDSSTAISFRGAPKNPASREEDWQTFELKNGDLVNAALVSLEKAYRDSRLRLFDAPPRRSKLVNPAEHHKAGLASTTRASI